MNHRRAPRWCLFLALGVSTAHPQTQVDLRTQSKSVDFAEAPSTRPLKTGPVLPPSCTEGELFFRTGVTPGENLYGCARATPQDPPQWVLEASGTGGGGTLPSMANNANKLLTTDGFVALWRSLTPGPTGALQIIPSVGDLAVDIVTAVLPQKSAANTFTGLNSFTQGLQLEPMAAPGSPANGRMWYDSSANKFRCREAALTKDCIGGGVGGAVSSVFGRLGDVVAQDNDYAGTATAYTSGKKQTFQSSATTAGARIACAALPSSPAAGDVACDSGDGNRLKVYNGTAWVSLGDGAGTPVTTTHYNTWLAANCQGTSATLGFATRTTGAATAACVTGTNTNYGVAQFADTETQGVQGRFPLPPDWTGDINFDLRWRSSATTGSAVWQIQPACVADGETGDPAWNTPQTITDAAKGGANQFNDAALASALTVTGCAAGEDLFFRLFRDPGHASDDLNATAELLWIRFKLRRAQ